MFLKTIYIIYAFLSIFMQKKGSELNQTEVKKLKKSKFQSFLTFLFERVKHWMRAHSFAFLI